MKKNINILKNISVLKLTSAGFVSQLGSQISYFAMLKKVYDLSNGRITDLGFLSIAKCIPYILFGIAAGIIIDRFKRKNIMILSDVINGFIALSVIFINNLNLIYFVSFLSASVNVFRTPAQKAFEPNLVSKDDIIPLNSLTSMMDSINMIIGSAAGAAVVGFFGVKTSFIIDALSFYISAFLIFTIVIKENVVKKKMHFRYKMYIKEFTDGTSILRKNSVLRTIVIINMYVSFAMAMQPTLIYVFIKESLHMGSRAEIVWGMLLSSLGIGSVFGSVIIGILLKKCRNKLKLYLNILLFDSFAFTLFILNRYFPLSIVIFAFLGIIGTADSIILNSSIQSITKDKERGKVFSTISMLQNPIEIVSIYIGTTAAAFFTAKYVLLAAAFLEAVISVSVRLTKSYKE